MNIKKEVYTRLIKKLREDQNDLRGKIFTNKMKMDTQVLEQTVMKRQLAATEDLIRDLGDKKEGLQ